MDSALRHRVFAVIEKIVQIDPATLDPSRDVRDQVSFDSMQFVELSARIEKELGIELPMAVMEARTINEFLELVERAMK
jgi:acyl carrier protein